MAAIIKLNPLAKNSIQSKTKVCHKCNEEKPVDEFYLTASRGISERCKKCTIKINSKRVQDKKKDIFNKLCF